MNKFLTLLMIFSFIASPISAQEAIINVDQVKLRKCGDQKCPKINVLSKGTKCTIIATGKIQSLDGYGSNAWVQVDVGGEIGYVYSGLLEVQNQSSQETMLDTMGYVREKNVNVRACHKLKECAILFRLYKGQYCKVISKTKHTENINKMGEHPWYFIEVNNKRGYVYGGLLILETAKLAINSSQVKGYAQPNGRVLGTLKRGSIYSIVAQSKQSELIRPYGRHYWYKIKGNNIPKTWVYGAFTSKANASVDCQCVDYVKNVLAISGPTKNAFEWEEVLQGDIPVTKGKQQIYLDYREIFDLKDVKKGDIVIFDKRHRQADNDYGHIGLVGAALKDDRSVIVEGGNHEVPAAYLFTRHKCNNVSNKLYQISDYVRFFRPVNQP